jgi:dTDP-4-dehydrorhamnose reductase
LAVGGAVVRVAWIYGFGPGRLNFGRAVVEKLARGEEVKAIADQWGSPTLNTLIAEVVARLAEREYAGVLHAAGPRMSRYEFALAIAETLGFAKSLVKPISMAEAGYKGPRPRDSSLVSRRAVEMLGVPIDDINYALSIFKKEWLKQSHATS